MKNKIQEICLQSTFLNTSAKTIYVADYTERTGSIRKVEIHTSLPDIPNGDGEMIV